MSIVRVQPQQAGARSGADDRLAGDDVIKRQALDVVQSRGIDLPDQLRSGQRAAWASQKRDRDRNHADRNLQGFSPPSGTGLFGWRIR